MERAEAKEIEKKVKEHVRWDIDFLEVKESYIEDNYVVLYRKSHNGEYVVHNYNDRAKTYRGSYFYPGISGLVGAIAEFKERD